MPVTHYTEDEVQEYTRLLAECYKHIEHGSATEIAKHNLLEHIRVRLGWNNRQGRDDAVMAERERCAQIVNDAAEVDNHTEAFRLLRLIDAEFRTDPQSVQCFDLRIVERVRKCVERRDEIEREIPWLKDEN